MIRKALIILLMGPLLAGAIASGTSVPVLALMGSLILIALAQSSVREEQEDYGNDGG
jgi:hypothetical protein